MKDTGAATRCGEAPREPKLLDQIRARIRTKHYSIRTENVYVDWARRTILHFGKRHPRQLSAKHVEAFFRSGSAWSRFGVDASSGGRYAACGETRHGTSNSHRVGPSTAMPNYRRAWHPGGTYFLTVNLLERHGNDLLMRRIDDLRAAFREVRAAYPFETHAWVVLPDHLHCVIELPRRRGIRAMRSLPCAGG